MLEKRCLDELAGARSRALRVKVKDQTTDPVGELIGLGASSCLGIDTDNILSTGGTHKRTSVPELEHNSINSILESCRLDKLALGVDSLEDGAVLDNNLDKTVGEVGVGLVPDLGGPLTLGQDGLDKEEVREGIADGLVDDLGEGAEGSDGNSLGWGRALGRVDGLESRGAKDDGAVSVGLKVNSDIVLQSLMMQVLDSGGDA